MRVKSEGQRTSLIVSNGIPDSQHHDHKRDDHDDDDKYHYYADGDGDGGK